MVTLPKSADSSVALHVADLEIKIEEIADQAGISGATRLSMGETLAALSQHDRRRLRLYLESARSYSQQPSRTAAANILLTMAEHVWGEDQLRGADAAGGASASVSRR